MPRRKRVAVQVKTLSTVTFYLGKEECAVPITDVRQIIRDVPITKVPNVNVHVEGVINLRGIVVPIVDLKHRLGLGVRTISQKHRLLIVGLGERRVGFSVDSVGGVFEFDEASLQPPPDVVIARVASHFVKGVVQRENSLVLLLDIHEILNLKGKGTAAEHHASAASHTPRPHQY